MASQSSHNDETPHFLLFPLMSPGHMMPMIDFARLLAAQGVFVSIVTTPHNADRFAPQLARDAAESGSPAIRVFELPLSGEEAGLPPGCENFDQLPSLGLAANLFAATAFMREPAEELFVRLEPRPSCIISDVCLTWTAQVAKKFNIPRLIFQAISCFCLMCLNSFQYLPKVFESLKSDTDSFVLPGLPHQIEFTKSQLPIPDPKLNILSEQIMAAEKDTYGVVINTFEELEPEYVEGVKKLRNGKLWCIGPVSLCNRAKSDKFERGNKASIGEEECLNWLDSHEPNSVLYACLGSLCNLIPAQLIELGLGLEASAKPFIWVIRERNLTLELEEWISGYGFEERVKGRGLLIRGWAPQVLILSHRAVGGFLTHCGWNSSFEAVCAGMPVATWPLFAEQFTNEKMLVDVLGIGVRVGVQKTVNWGEEEEIGVLVKSEAVQGAVDELMGGAEREERRNRAKELAEKASKAVEEGGSSYLNMSSLIKEIMELARGRERSA